MFANSISEIVLVVRDVPVAARFYRDVVGLAPLTEVSAEWAWFWTGEVGASVMLGLRCGTLLFEERSPRPAGARWGPVHYAFRVPRDQLDAAVEHVRSRGVTVHGPVRLAWMNAESYYFYDLDDNLLEWWSPDPAGGTQA